MGRPRLNNKDNRLPPRVYKNKYSYIWKPQDTGSSITLAPVIGTSMSALWVKYEAEKAKRANVMTVAKLWNLFLESPVFTELAPRTQKDYRQHQRALLNVFGKMLADSVKIEQVRIFMDKRGMESKTQANHELASLSRVYGWGYERGYVKGNPCKGLGNSRRKPEPSTSQMNSTNLFMLKLSRHYRLLWRFHTFAQRVRVMFWKWPGTM